MVDGSVSGLVVTAVIDAVIFTILLIIFLATRKSRSRPPEGLAPEHSTVLSEHGTSFIQALKSALREPHSSKIAMLGKETWAYLQVHKIIAFILISLTIFGWAPLIAVYITGSESVDTDVEQTSFAHVYGDDDLLAAPMVFLFLFSIIYSVALVIMAKKFLANAVQQPEDERHIAANILMAVGLPKDLNSIEQSPLIFSLLKAELSEVTSVYIVPNYAPAYRTSLLIKEAKAALALAKEREPLTGKPEMVRPKLCAKKVKAEIFYTAKIEELEAQQIRELDGGRHLSSGQAFIEFSSVQAAEKAQQGFHKMPWQPNDFNIAKWKVTHAPSLSELNWHNLDANLTKIKVTRIVYQILFVFLFLIFLTPAAVLAYIGSLASFLGEWVIGFIGEYLPTIIIVLLHSVLLPWCIKFLVKKEMHYTKSAEILSATFKYFIFMLFYVFIIPLLGLQFIQIISSVVSGENEDWASLFATRLVKSSRFFTVLMIHAVFLGSGFDIVALGKVIVVAIKKKRALTDTERKQIYEADEFDIPRNYALSVVYTIIAMTFSISFPIMSTLALAFFSLRFVVHTYNMFYLTRRSYFQDLWKTIIWYLWLSLVFFHLFTGALFILTKTVAYVVLGIIFMMMGLVILVASIVFSYKVPKVLSIPKNIEGRSDAKLADYEHPMEVGLKEAKTEVAND